jgi:hypothetical protein
MAAGNTCTSQLTRDIPARNLLAPAGNRVVEGLADLGGTRRDAAILAEILQGNVPDFLRDLVPVTLSGTLSTGRDALVTLCVTPEYLAVGSDRDFVRVPLGLSAAARVAADFGFLLPTPRMVDAIHRQAHVRVAPSPMKPTAEMTSTRYLLAHNETVESQIARAAGPRAALAAGQKKDLVLSRRLLGKPGRVAIYGWHRPNGAPIQPLSTVHGAEYADYSHGVRLVSRTAFLDGRPVALEQIMRDPVLSALVSDEGPIDGAESLIDGYAARAIN